MVFNGTTWVTVVEEEPDEPDTPVEYTAYNINRLGAAGGCTASVVYAYTADGDALPKEQGDWDNAYTLEEGSGAGMKLNDTVLTATEIKQPGDLYINLGVDAVEGDVLTIDGTYYNATTARKFVFNNCKLQYNGTSWVKYIAYTTYTVDAIKAENSSSATAVYLIPADGDGNSLGSGDWGNVYTFEAESGAGLKLNDTVLTTTDIKQPGSFFIALGTTAVAGDILTIDGTYYNATAAKKIVFNNCKLIFDGEVWENYLDVVKADAKTALEEYKATFVEENYYEAEWEYFAELLENGKVSIDEAATEEDVAAVLAAAKTAMDEVVTKEESDAIFGSLKTTEKDNLKAYKSESDYRAADWQIIVGIIEKACAEIDKCESVTAINKVVTDAKAQIDAVKTAAQKTAEEKAVADAKAELAAYKSESDYRAEQWTEIQAIVNKAGADLDLAIGDAEEIAEIVTEAKAKIDAVKTKAQKDADDKVVADAKAELAAYKKQDNYKEEQWTEIQSILTKANADLDAANGNAEAIAEIVTATKAKLDKVLTAEQAEAAALEAAKAAGKKEVQEYYDILDHSLYTDEEETQISGFVAAAMSAINQAATAEEVNAAVAQFKANVDGVKQAPQTSNNDDNNNDNNSGGGCGSVTGIGGVVAGMALAAAAVAVLGKKKKDE